MNMDADDHMHTPLYIYIYIYMYTCTASSRAMPVFQYITKAKQKAHWNRTVDGWSPAWMGATFCCMNTISQLGEGELDIASGTLTGKKKCKDQTDTNSNVWICFCTLLEMCLWKKKSHRCVIYSGSQDQTGSNVLVCFHRGSPFLPGNEDPYVLLNNFEIVTQNQKGNKLNILTSFIIILA